MRNLCMVTSYDGSAYHGFQTQPNGNTIQDYIEKSILLLTGENIKIIASGRTDAGVHARCQIFNFRTHSQIPECRWALALNMRLPKDIVIQSTREVPYEFHARRWAKRKTYRYTINTNRYPDVFQRHTQFHHPTKLDVDVMRKALLYLIGEHDFSTFCAPRSQKESNVRTIYDAKIIQERSEYDSHSTGFLHLYVTGNGFLHHMVRIIAGTLLAIGEGKKDPDTMGSILAAKDRGMAGPTAMAHGLTLWEVSYE